MVPDQSHSGEKNKKAVKFEVGLALFVTESNPMISN